jgi:hypothetical protein
MPQIFNLIGPKLGSYWPNSRSWGVLGVLVVLVRLEPNFTFSFISKRPEWLEIGE